MARHRHVRMLGETPDSADAKPTATSISRGGGDRRDYASRGPTRRRRGAKRSKELMRRCG